MVHASATYGRVTLAHIIRLLAYDTSDKQGCVFVNDESSGEFDMKIVAYHLTSKDVSMSMMRTLGSSKEGHVFDDMRIGNGKFEEHFLNIYHYFLRGLNQNSFLH